MTAPDIICAELGSEEAERTSDAFECSVDDLRALQHHAALRRLALHPCDAGRFRVGGETFCGLIRLPSGRQIRIRSKLPTGTLLRWLAFTHEIPPLEAWSHSPALDVGDDFATALVRLYLDEVEIVTRFHRRPGYRQERRVASEVRGVLEERRLAAVASRLPAVPVRRRERVLDTLPNRVIAAGLRAAARLLPASKANESTPRQVQDRSSLARLTREWSDVSGEVTSGALDSALALAAPPVGYRVALQLARLLLVGASIDAVGGDGGDTFLVNLGNVWEEAVRRMAAAWASSSGWKHQANRIRHWDDDRTTQDPARWLDADALVQSPDGRRIVLDAKYKRDFGNEAREDRFQMAAYGLAFDADAVCLVYPVAEPVELDDRLLLRSSPGGKVIQIRSWALPMSVGPEACTEAVSRFLHSVTT